MVEVRGLNELLQDLNAVNKKALSKAARSGALEVAREITKEYKKNIPKQTGLLSQSAKAVTSYSLKKGVYRAASVVFKMRKITKKRFEVLTKAKKWTSKRQNFKKWRLDYFASAYYAYFIEHGFHHKGGVKKKKKGKSGAKFIQGTKTMQEARDKIDPQAHIIIQNKFYAELEKLGF